MNSKGFTLVELLVGLAISSIIIAAAYGSYIVIKNNYDFQKDMKNIAQTSRAVATMIMRDVRMAGYNFDDGPGKQNPVIINAISITDGGTTGPDSIEIIYDQSYTQRLKISYYSKPYPTTTSQRSRLYKKVERCDPSVNCGAGSLTTIIPESPIADYIEDFQLIGSKGNCKTGDVSYGCGTIKTITPIKATHGNQGGSSKCKDDPLEIFDSNPSTYWSCSTTNDTLVNRGWHYIKLEFAEDFRPITLNLGGSLGHLSGGSYNVSAGENKIANSGGGYYLDGGTHPWGTGRLTSVGMIFRFERSGDSDPWYDGTSWKCIWSDDKHCTNGKDYRRTIMSPLYSNSWLQAGNVHSFTVSPSSASTYDLRQTQNTSGDRIIFASVSKYLTINIIDRAYVCAYGPSDPQWSNRMDTPGKCNIHPTTTNITIPDMNIIGEVFGSSLDFNNIEIALLIRSPEQHGSTPKSQTWTIGNRPINTNDSYIRDTYSTSALVRNLYYE